MLFSRLVVSNFLWPQACLSFTISSNSNSCPLSRWFHPTISSAVVPFSSRLHSFPASGVFSNESAFFYQWPKYWSFSFSISPFNGYSGLISFRIDRFDLLAVQGTLESLLQHHIWKASILWGSAFSTAQLSHPYMTTRKTFSFSHIHIAVTTRTFVCKVCLCFLICCLGWS